MPDYTVLIGQKLIDGTGNKPIENPEILIQGSKIIAVGKQDELIIPNSENITRLYYEDETLLPGLIDCHVPICMSADDNPLA